jgi:hypothetical protein
MTFAQSVRFTANCAIVVLAANDIRGDNSASRGSDDFATGAQGARAGSYKAFAHLEFAISCE